jgi:preprotein translocase subunit Sec61beta
LTPLLAQAQVGLGAAAGQLVSTGVSSSLGAITMFPDFGTVGITPQSGIGVVPANHTGNQGTFYVSVVNAGLIDFFDFNAGNDAQLTVLVVPVANVLSVGVYATNTVSATMNAPGIGIGMGGITMLSGLFSMGTPSVTIT